MRDDPKENIRIRRYSGAASDRDMVIAPSRQPMTEETMTRQAAGLPVQSWLLFLHEIRTGLVAGIPLLKVLDLTYKTSHRRTIREIAEKLRAMMAAGTGLEAGLNSSPWIPDIIRFHLIAGMRSGEMVRSIDFLINHYEWLSHMRRKLLSVCIYPAVLVIIGVLVMIFRDIMIRHLGKSQDAVSDIWLPITLQYALPVIVGAGAAWMLGTLYRWNSRNAVLNRLLLAVPFIGSQIKSYSIALVLQVFSTGIRSGMPVTAALSGGIRSCPNSYIAEKFSPAVGKLKAGETISNALKSTGVLDAESLGIISTGEYAGNLPDILDKTVNRYKQFIQVRMNGLIPTLAPIFVLLMAFAYFANPIMLGVLAFLLMFLRKMI